MAQSQLEKLMNRRQVDAVIKADPVRIVFIRTPMVRQSDNSFAEGTPVELKPQEVAIIPFKRRLTESVISSEFGEIPNTSYVLVGRFNLDIERNDVFWWQEEKYRVVSIDLKKEVHKVAVIDYYGKPDHHANPV